MRKTILCLLALLSFAFAQSSSKAGLLTTAELQKVIPPSFFYAGKTATVQVRNSAGLRTASGKLVLASLVDTGGYSTQIQEKYQGFLMADGKVKIGEKELAPGAYGIGAVGSNFLVTDLGANEIVSMPLREDSAMKRPTPLKMVSGDKGTQLCLGRKCVEFSAE
jgi:hypothetical protein